MIERLPKSEIRSPLHLAHCAFQLIGMYIQEQKIAFKDMLDDAFDVDFGDEE